MTALFAYLPALACGASIAVVWKSLTILESISKPSFKNQVATAIVSSSLFALGTRLPRFCVNAFEAIFTDRIWSIRGFIRSCIGSIIVVSILFAVWLSSIPQGWHIRVADLPTARAPHTSTWCLIGVHGYGIDIDSRGNLHTNPRIAFAQGHQYVEALTIHRLDVFVILPFFYNLFADFVALNMTWRILKKLASYPNISTSKLFGFFTLSSLLLLALSFVALDAAVTIINYIISAGLRNPPPAPPESITNFTNFVKVLVFPFYKAHPNEWDVSTLYGVFVWSTLIGIGWIAVFTTSVIVANAAMKLKGVGPWLGRNLDVKRVPFRILGVLIIVPLGVSCLMYHVLQWIL